VAHRNPDFAELRAAAAVMRRHDIAVVPVNYRVPPKSGPAFYGRLLKNVFSPLPYSVATHTSRAMRRAMDGLTRTDPPDLWHCEWTPYARAMVGRPGPWVVMAHNVESVIWQRFAQAETSPLRKSFLRRQWERFERFESWAYAAATRAVAVSEQDADRIERLSGTRAAVVENGVDTDFFQPADAVPRDPHRVLFLGSLDWRPNLDAAQQLLDDIFPRVRAVKSRATLAIVGRKPPEWLRERARNTPGVELHADVPDVRPFLHAAGMMVVPLRVGGGSRLKILEALATGLPVVTTTVGVEGLRLSDGEHCWVADGSEAFASAVLDAMNDPAHARQAAAAGQARVRGEYDWAGLADRLGEVWEEAARGSEHTDAINRRIGYSFQPLGVTPVN
ncbi:MAG TPA: glycosyltransferase, partial [Gemmataceae bacterium]|nr:glycosyltransferase [Gemmataceae bacterium]